MDTSNFTWDILNQEYCPVLLMCLDSVVFHYWYFTNKVSPMNSVPALQNGSRKIFGILVFCFHFIVYVYTS